MMEYVEGLTLHEKIKDGRLTIRETIVYAIQIAKALQVAHEKGILHRDIKSENVMITSTGQVKVMDFGLATIRHDADRESQHLTKERTTTGTVAFMSPEQIQGLNIDLRSDIFSFGVVLYELITVVVSGAQPKRN